MKNGSLRERQVKNLLEQEGWFVVKAGGSLGCADLVALKAKETPRLIQVKAEERGPYNGFGPNDRFQLRAAALAAGAKAELCWWPSRKRPSWIPEDSWPE